MHFKRFDIFGQIAVPISALIYFFLIDNTLDGILKSVAILYGGLAIWQLSSAVIHLFYPELRKLNQSRQIYYLVLIAALPICLYPLFNNYKSSIIPPVIMGSAMAIFYFAITIKEFRILKQNESIKNN